MYNIGSNVEEWVDDGAQQHVVDAAWIIRRSSLAVDVLALGI